jgi:hypothetical protein
MIRREENKEGENEEEILSRTRVMDRLKHYHRQTDRHDLTIGS